jgi:iron-sulfur cluster repair protein YtfE (RIC family)
MTSTAAFRVTPRQDGDPVADVTGMRLAHRTMLADAARLTSRAEQFAAGTTGSPAAFADYVRDFADSVHHHHTAEDDVLWPVLAESAGPCVDLTELSDDHAALVPVLDRLRRCADAFQARPAEDAATALATVLAELSATLGEHIAEEEADLFPVIERYVSAGDWAKVVKAIHKRAKLTFEVPRNVLAATPEELAAAKAEGGLPMRVMVALLVPPFRRRERAVFGV